ncbi:hypothetical protein [Aquamicrobium zhengzhouense]|uniref:Uncharacterized protein n=1 Tax=Aquamicrobium zhengzhouense TaxID=2781738 RepID=A0ABS0SEE5_9HYPH|nr:hypothetical protein [Aquamicrobium zhengzhouense]MBI1621672.1 hypothetical protein [Aquamicrobium zhengzhouense]
MIIQESPWNNLSFDPELRPYIQLDHVTISKLSQEAMIHPDPRQFLIDAIHLRAKERRDVLSGQRRNEKCSTELSWQILPSGHCTIIAP